MKLHQNGTVFLMIKLAALAAGGWAETLYETTPKWHGFLDD